MPRLKNRLPAKPGETPLFERRPVPAPALSSAQIRAARALLGVPQRELAAMLGIGFRTLSGYESGEKRCSGEFCSHVLAAFYELGVVFPAGGAGIEGKFKDGGRKKAIGDAAQLLTPAERWIEDEVESPE